MPVIDARRRWLAPIWCAATCIPDDPLFDPALRAFPPVFVVRLPDGPAARWVAASIRYALATTCRTSSAGRIRTSTRLPELVLIEVLRIHLARPRPPTTAGSPRSHDPVLAPALALLHAAPGAQVDGGRTRVRRSAVSRSVLDERFRSVLGRSPIRYLTEWRMHLADDLFATTDLGVAIVARRVGYDSEEAFSRAFKRIVACRRVSGATHLPGTRRACDATRQLRRAEVSRTCVLGKSSQC